MNTKKNAHPPNGERAHFAKTNKGIAKKARSQMKTGVFHNGLCRVNASARN